MYLLFEGTYSLDQMSDDEDLEPVRPSRQSGSGGQITSSQMAAALAAISGSQSPVSEPLPLKRQHEIIIIEVVYFKLSNYHMKMVLNMDILMYIGTITAEQQQSEFNFAFQ